MAKQCFIFLQLIMNVARKPLYINLDEDLEPIVSTEHTPGSVCMSVKTENYQHILDSPGALLNSAPLCNVVRSLQDRVVESANNILIK